MKNTKFTRAACIKVFLRAYIKDIDKGSPHMIKYKAVKVFATDGKGI